MIICVTDQMCDQILSNMLSLASAGLSDGPSRLPLSLSLIYNIYQSVGRRSM